MKTWGISLILLFFNSLVYTQILVVREDQSGFMQPISDEDIEKYNKPIVEILLKYTWPTCIAHDLTEEEKIELLTPAKSGAELEFVRKKIKAISKDLNVIFVPTTLYELFLIKSITNKNLSTKSQTPDLSYLFSNGLGQKKHFDVLKEINKEFNDFNNKLYGSLFENRSILDFHKSFIEYLKKLFATSYNFKLSYIHSFLYEKRYELKDQLLNDNNFNLPIDAKDLLGIIKKGIDLDYQAFNANKTLLFRGSNFLNIPSFYQSKRILATTIHGTIYGDSTNIPLKKMKDIPSYSISFGNSLFAGIYNDLGACSYNYLKSIKDMGYAILIDKLAYIDNYITNLFFIAPLATEVGLLGNGEWFHSRSKPSVLVKSNEAVHVYGVAGGSIWDPYGIFLIVRSPYRQAQLFSEYLAKNGIILHQGEYKDLTEEEKQGLTALMKNQQEVGVEYKIIGWFKNLENKLKKRFFDKKIKEGLRPALI